MENKKVKKIFTIINIAFLIISLAVGFGIGSQHQLLENGLNSINAMLSGHVNPEEFSFMGVLIIMLPMILFFTASIARTVTNKRKNWIWIPVSLFISFCYLKIMPAINDFATQIKFPFEGSYLVISLVIYGLIYLLLIWMDLSGESYNGGSSDNGYSHWTDHYGNSNSCFSGGCT